MIKPRVEAEIQFFQPIEAAAEVAIREQAASIGAVLVVDECRRTGAGVADAILADLAEAGIGRRLWSVRAVDSFVPLGTATSAVLIVDSVR